MVIITALISGRLATLITVESISGDEIAKIRIPVALNSSKVVEILSLADREISLLQKDLELEKQKKKALMQLLLTGIVRY